MTGPERLDFSGIEVGRPQRHGPRERRLWRRRRDGSSERWRRRLGLGEQGFKTAFDLRQPVAQVLACGAACAAEMVQQCIDERLFALNLVDQPSHERLLAGQFPGCGANETGISHRRRTGRQQEQGDQREAEHQDGEDGPAADGLRTHDDHGAAPGSGYRGAPSHSPPCAGPVLAAAQKRRKGPVESTYPFLEEWAPAGNQTDPTSGARGRCEILLLGRGRRFFGRLLLVSLLLGLLLGLRRGRLLALRGRFRSRRGGLGRKEAEAGQVSIAIVSFMVVQFSWESLSTDSVSRRTIPCCGRVALLGDSPDTG